MKTKVMERNCLAENTRYLQRTQKKNTFQGLDASSGIRNKKRQLWVKKEENSIVLHRKKKIEREKSGMESSEEISEEKFAQNIY